VVSLINQLANSLTTLPRANKALFSYTVKSNVVLLNSIQIKGYLSLQDQLLYKKLRLQKYLLEIFTSEEDQIRVMNVLDKIENIVKMEGGFSVLELD
jgi:hypothetical protein